jgi:poly-beta-1,6-N-acetyl-D-glucosamine synthase
MQVIFWISFSLLFYTYLGYGLLLILYNAFVKKKQVFDEDFQPPVTLIVPCYNEEFVIRQKIENSLALDYPSSLISLLFVSDGSFDKTEEIIRSYPQINLLHTPERRGKTAAINRAMQQVKTPFVIFTDANTMLNSNCTKKLIRHFIQPDVGGVSGEKRIAATAVSTVGFGENIYWQYESILKKANAAFYTIVGAAGELFAIRTNLFQLVDESVILDDFVISANVCRQGYRFLYEEEAYAVETSSANLHEERKRKVRISAGCYQALFLHPGLLNPFKNIRLSFQYISHRVMRWVLCPILLPVLFVTNTILFLQQEDIFYELFFWCQVIFYIAAFTGCKMEGKKPGSKFLTIPAYFIFMILSQYAGFYRYIRKKQTVFWEKATRQPFTR